MTLKPNARWRTVACSNVQLPRLRPKLPFVGWAALLLACQGAAPPKDAEYPSLVLPAQISPAEPAPKAATPAAAPPLAAGSRPLAAPASDPAALAPEAEHSPESKPQGDLPDPEPLSERGQWTYAVTYDRGVIGVGAPTLACLPRPRTTPRKLGRYAFELWLGRELIERLRFDFPLLANEEPLPSGRRPIYEDARFAPGARTSVVLQVPVSDRAGSARILDRATGEVVAVPWPPAPADGATRPRECPRSGKGPTTAARQGSATRQGSPPQSERATPAR